jgi:hypothetical protein
MIGEGGFGAVYRGALANGQEVAVKVRSSSSTQGTREFNNEVQINPTHIRIVFFLLKKIILAKMNLVGKSLFLIMDVAFGCHNLL